MLRFIPKEFLVGFVLLNVAVGFLLWPRIFGFNSHDPITACDALYVALDGEIANALDARSIPARSIVDQVILAHADAGNPLDRDQPAYVQSHDPLFLNHVPSGTAGPCQVLLVAEGPYSVALHQVPKAGAPARSVRIGLD